MPYTPSYLNYSEIVEEVMVSGRSIEPTGEEYPPTWEKLGVSFLTLPNTTLTHNNINPAICWLEGLAALQAIDPTKHIHRVSKSALPFFERTPADYGVRLAPALSNMTDLLEKYPDTRQAIGYPAAGPSKRKGIPCIGSYQLFIRDKRLYTSVTMRSLDLVKGLPSDVVIVNMISAYIANLLDIQQGFTFWYFGSAHVYKEDTERAIDCKAGPMFDIKPLHPMWDQCRMAPWVGSSVHWTSWDRHPRCIKLR